MYRSIPFTVVNRTLRNTINRKQKNGTKSKIITITLLYSAKNFDSSNASFIESIQVQNMRNMF